MKRMRTDTAFPGMENDIILITLNAGWCTCHTKVGLPLPEASLKRQQLTMSPPTTYYAFKSILFPTSGLPGKRRMHPLAAL